MNKSIFCLIFLVFCCLLSPIICVNIKIVDGIDRVSEPNSLDSESSTLNQPADLFSGPPALLFLSEYCFKTEFDRWEYNICPFHNVTQRRIAGQKYSLLGIWGRWIFESTSELDHHLPKRKYQIMEFSDGKSCGDEINAPLLHTILTLDCLDPRNITSSPLSSSPSLDDVKISSVDDSHFCKYQMNLKLPISCDLLYY